MPDPLRCARVVDAGGQALGQTKPPLDLAQDQQETSRPPSEDSCPPSKRAIRGLPATGDRPGRDGVDSTLAGMVSGRGWI